MTTQIIKLNKKTAKIKTVNGKEITVKINTFAELKNNLVGMIESAADIKTIVTFYQPVFCNEKFWGSFVSAHCPTASQQKQTKKRAANRRKIWDSKETEAIAKAMSNHTGFIPTGNPWEALS